jgi:multidrug resistance protein, MATE family
MTPRPGASHRQLLALAGPNLVSMMSYSLLALVNAIWVGQLGTAELGAIGVAMTVLYGVSSFPLGLLGAVRTPVATFVGAGRLDLARRTSWQGIWLALGLGLLALPLANLGPVVFPWMGVSDAVLGPASEYAFVRLLGAPLWFAVTALQAAFQGRGDSRTPMAATLVANVVNLVVDPILVFGWGPFPALGMVGAALGVDLGLALAVLVLASRAGFLGRPVGPDRALLREIWRIGGPSAFQFQLDVFSYLFFQALLVASGDVALAAHVVVVRIVMASFLPAQALSDAVGVLVGHARGAGRFRDAFQVVRLGAVQVTAFMLAMGLLFTLVPDRLVGVFGASPEVVAAARPILLMWAVFQVLDGLAQVCFGALNGAGDTRYAFAVTTVGAWFVKLPVAAWLVVGLDLGAYGAWLGVAAECVWQVAMTTWRLRGVRWVSDRRARSATVSA